MRYFILFICFISAGCRPAESDLILLFNDVYFRLRNNERVEVINREEQQFFQSHFDSTKIQAPLFKLIKSNTYTIFLAIPFNTSLSELRDVQEFPNDSLILEKQENSSFYEHYQLNADHAVIYARNFDGNLIYMLSVASNIGEVDSLFSLNKVSNRFVQ